VTLLVDALVVGGAIVVGRWIFGKMRALRGREGTGATQGGEAPSEPPRDPLAGFPCRLGDVVLRTAERDEAWLAGALVLEEERPVAALFVAPEAGGDRALFVRDAPGAGLVWLAPLAPGSLALTKEPPSALEHEGTRFERTRRLPVRVVRVGSGAPAVGDQAIVAEYTGAAADRLLVVAGRDLTLAWRGVLLREGEYDVLPGGKRTLED